ncbi:30S ribosomal protein S9 [candidate division TA06 bacterium]|nr:30S ribosomal protein S9 [candidate division TA06 bacterium]
MQDLYYEATGRRKESTARVRLAFGEGKRVVNGKPMAQYFGRESLMMLIEKPLKMTGTRDRFDIYARVRGGGISGQAGAVQLALARALLEFDEDFHAEFRKAGLLTRDSRQHERMKCGLAKRRKRFQFSKR